MEAGGSPLGAAAPTPCAGSALQGAPAPPPLAGRARQGAPGPAAAVPQCRARRRRRRRPKCDSRGGRHAAARPVGTMRSRRVRWVGGAPVGVRAGRCGGGSPEWVSEPPPRVGNVGRGRRGEGAEPECRGEWSGGRVAVGGTIKERPGSGDRKEKAARHAHTPSTASSTTISRAFPPPRTLRPCSFPPRPFPFS